MYIYIYIHIYIYIYIYIYIEIYRYTLICICSDPPLGDGDSQVSGLNRLVTADLRTNIMDVRGFDSSIILILRGEIPRPIGDFPESLSQATLGVMLVRKSGVHTYMCSRLYLCLCRIRLGLVLCLRLCPWACVPAT